jgi:hypothetical protein
MSEDTDQVAVELNETAGATITSSITMKLLGTKAAAKLLAQDESVREMYFGFVYGSATAVATAQRETDQGELVTDEFLRGEFGLDTHDGKTYTSGKCYLPDAVQGLISAQLVDEDGKAVKGARITFGFEIWAKRDTNKAGFTWQFKPIMRQSSKSPIELLRTRLLPHTHGQRKPEAPALPAPVAEAPAQESKRGKKRHETATDVAPEGDAE